MNRINYNFSRIDAIKLFFSTDKDDFLWKHITDQEKALRGKDSFELASIIASEKAANSQRDTCDSIIAEHLLGIRLSKIQARASLLSGMLSFLGAIVGAIVGALLLK